MSKLNVCYIVRVFGKSEYLAEFNDESYILETDYRDAHTFNSKKEIIRLFKSWQKSEHVFEIIPLYQHI